MTDICSISVKSRRKGKDVVLANPFRLTAVWRAAMAPKPALKVRTAIKAGGIDCGNHSRRLMAVGS